MSFRKRNVGLSPGSSRNADTPLKSVVTALPGVRPSPLDGRPTTSTGTATLDGLLAGHAGLALGTSLLVEENGTTDYAGPLLRFYTAEGLAQGHHVHVVGPPEQWGRNLPGLAGSTEGGSSSAAQDKMKIAWRYENLGQFGGEQASRGGHIFSLRSMSVSTLIIYLSIFVTFIVGLTNG
jgi:elongator complex protein 4